MPTALSNLQTEAKTIIVDAIDLKVCHVRKLQTKSVVDGIAQLASVFMTFYGISSTNAMADPMWLNTICSMPSHTRTLMLCFSVLAFPEDLPALQGRLTIFFVNLETLVLKNLTNVLKLMK